MIHRCPAALALLFLVLSPSPARGGEPGRSSVPAPFEALRLETQAAGAEVALWGRRYRFSSGPLPDSVRSQGRELFARAPEIRVGAERVTWQPVEAVEATPRRVRLRSTGRALGVELEAETQIEYDGMIEVQLVLRGDRVARLDYELSLAPGTARLFAHHLPYDYQVANVDKDKLLEAAGRLPDRLALDFVPTLALGGYEVGVEWWSETNAHWKTRAGEPAFEVVRTPAGHRLRVTPIAAPLPLDGAWRDRFALFVFPSRPPPRHWRSVRMLPYNRAANFENASPDTQFLSLAMQRGFHARYDGLPGSVDDAFQRALRARLDEIGVGYMPYGMLTLAPILHPRTLEAFPRWSAEGRWWKTQPGQVNAVLRRTHPDLEPGTPITYPVCAAASDYFDWMLEENVRTLRDEKLDALYFDLGGITRMCVRSPRLAGKSGRESWEYGNLRRFYQRLYEETQRVRPGARIVIHTHGAPKALGAFVDFHMFGEALNKVFANGVPTARYRANPELYRPDYLALPDGFLDAQFHPRVGGVPSLLPQIKWAIDSSRPGRSRAFQRGLQALVLLNDLHAPLWVSDVDAAEAVWHALDRFGSLADAVVFPWWSNADVVQRPPGLHATLYRTERGALLVMANLGSSEVRGTVQLDPARLSLPPPTAVRDLEHPGRAPRPVQGARFETSLAAGELRLLAFE